MGFFGWTVYGGGGGFHPPAVSTNFALIGLKFSQDMENHVWVKNQEKIGKKISGKLRENTLILRIIRWLFKLALEMAGDAQYLQFCIKTMSDD